MFRPFAFVVLAWMSVAPLSVRADEFRIESLDEGRKARMRGVSWREGCPVALEDLAVVHLRHWNAKGEPQPGELVVARRVADDVLKAFRGLFDAHFVIDSVKPIESFAGSDDASMAANNTSAFNCRPVFGGTEYSRHSYGEAIDLNPLQNPYVRGKVVAPPEGRKWLARKPGPGVIVAKGAAVKAFSAIGWKWGGDWKKYKDFQHFSSDGR